MLQFPSSAQKKFTEVLQTTRGVWFCTNPIYTTTYRKETKNKTGRRRSGRTVADPAAATTCCILTTLVSCEACFDLAQCLYFCVCTSSSDHCLALIYCLEAQPRLNISSRGSFLLIPSSTDHKTWKRPNTNNLKRSYLLLIVVLFVVRCNRHRNKKKLSCRQCLFTFFLIKIFCVYLHISGNKNRGSTGTKTITT